MVGEVCTCTCDLLPLSCGMIETIIYGAIGSLLAAGIVKLTAMGVKNHPHFLVWWAVTLAATWAFATGSFAWRIGYGYGHRDLLVKVVDDFKHSESNLETLESLLEERPFDFSLLGWLVWLPNLYVSILPWLGFLNLGSGAFSRSDEVAAEGKATTKKTPRAKRKPKGK